MKLKKLLVSILAMACVATTMHVAAFASEVVEPDLTISTKAELEAFAEDVNGGKDYSGKLVVLIEDIDLKNEEWTPIGTGTRSGNSYAGGSFPFKGTFDGNGKTISNLAITKGSGNDAVGLFGVLDGATVENIVFTDVNINTSAENAGAAVGLMVNDSTVKNITVDGSITAPDGVGGVVGAAAGHGGRAVFGPAAGVGADTLP